MVTTEVSEENFEGIITFPYNRENNLGSMKPIMKHIKEIQSDGLNDYLANDLISEQSDAYRGCKERLDRIRRRGATIALSIIGK